MSIISSPIFVMARVCKRTILSECVFALQSGNAKPCFPPDLLLLCELMVQALYFACRDLLSGETIVLSKTISTHLVRHEEETNTCERHPAYQKGAEPGSLHNAGEATLRG